MMVKDAASQIHDVLSALKISRIHFTLDYFKKALESFDLDCPQATIVTVAGTNGKGTCSAVIESLAVHYGYQVGCFVSPHIHTVNERIRLNQSTISDDQLLDYLLEIESSKLELSYFETIAVAALMAFRDFKCDFWVLEAGLGGRLDAMNALDFSLANYVSVLVSVGLDHQQWLGQTRFEIMREKLGYSRKACPLVVAEKDLPEGGKELLEKTKAKVSRVDVDYRCENYQWIRPGHRVSVELPHYSLDSVSAALEVMHQLSCQVNQKDFMLAMSQLVLPGRFEIIEKHSITWVFDVAHNSESMGLLAETIKKNNFSPQLVLAVNEDKSLMPGLYELVKFCQEVIYLESIFGKMPLNLSTALQSRQVKVKCKGSVDEVVHSIYKNGCVLVTGSFKTVEAFRSYVIST